GRHIEVCRHDIVRSEAPAFGANGCQRVPGREIRDAVRRRGRLTAQDISRARNSASGPAGARTIDMEQVIANGLYLGAQYALIALGLTLIFALMSVLNFAHGQMYVLGGFVTYTVYGQLGMPF